MQARKEKPNSSSSTTLLACAIGAGIILSYIAMASLRGFTLNKQIFNATLYSRIQAVWFSGLPQGATIPPESMMRRWFYDPDPNQAEKEAFDASCRDFLPVLEAIGPAAYPLPPLHTTDGVSAFAAEQAAASSIAAPFHAAIAAGATPGIDQQTAASTNASNYLSLILLLDQITRNSFRDNQGVIYMHYDRISRALLRTLLSATPRPDRGPGMREMPVHRRWFYLPLMHSEHLEDHATHAALMKEFMEDMHDAGLHDSAAWLQQAVDFGREHTEIIEKFGRYPYRNKFMGRETTTEEREWIEAGGKTFGAG